MPGKVSTRDKVTTGLEVAGFLLLSAGAGVHWEPEAGLAAAGVSLVLVGIVEGRKS